MNRRRSGLSRFTILLLALLMAVTMLLPKAFCVAGTEQFSKLSDTASAEIAQADAGFNQAFKTVLAADQAGANVTGLLGQLDEAEGNVTEAKADYTAGNQTKAYTEASISLSLSDNVETKANGLKNMALANAANTFHEDLAFSSVGAAAFLLALYFGWRWFKRERNSKKLLRLKPEATPDAEA